MPIHWGLTNKPLRLKPEGCPNGLGEHSALLAQAGVFFLLHGKRRHPVGFSFRAEVGEAKVHQPPLVLIGGGCFTENADILSAFPKGRSR